VGGVEQLAQPTEGTVPRRAATGAGQGLPHQRTQTYEIKGRKTVTRGEYASHSKGA
jgi:hypothetical protein